MCAYACRHVSTDKREVCIPYGNGENFTDLGRTSFEHEWIQCLTCGPRTQPLTSSVSSILSVAISPGWPPGWSKVVPGQMHPLWSNSKNGGGSSPSWQEARTILVGPDQFGFRDSRVFSPFSSWRVARLESTGPGSFHGTGVRISSGQDSWLSRVKCDDISRGASRHSMAKSMHAMRHICSISTTRQTKMPSSFKYISC